ncbi:hypothetical protein SHKM778_12890 [Streptomyces sp. KM77-8]|uniref:Amidohydrolase 3 domain-containing protein n=1 Tax=Streptomyces haneummycinicus TaxID=3074435 RepID=A0AAT9HBY5_9ACTN
MDGSGDHAYRADVVVDGGRIVSIVKEAADAGCQRPKARRELDAEGLVLAPGFIDMHAHSDLALLRDPDHSAKAAQGSPSKSWARTGCRTRRSTTVRSVRCAGRSPGGTAPGTTSTSTGGRWASIWTGSTGASRSTPRI